jgi:hypothetical protein
VHACTVLCSCGYVSIRQYSYRARYGPSCMSSCAHAKLAPHATCNTPHNTHHTTHTTHQTPMAVLLVNLPASGSCERALKWLRRHNWDMPTLLHRLAPLATCQRYTPLRRVRESCAFTKLPFRTEQNKMLDGLGGRFVWRSVRWVFGVRQLAPDGTPPPLEVFRKKSN